MRALPIAILSLCACATSAPRPTELSEPPAWFCWTGHSEHDMSRCHRTAEACQSDLAAREREASEGETYEPCEPRASATCVTIWGEELPRAQTCFVEAGQCEALRRYALEVERFSASECQESR